MAAEQLIIDPTDEASGTQLDMSDGTVHVLLEHAYPPPPVDAAFAGSADTEGDLPSGVRYRNRTVTAKVRVYGASPGDVQARIATIEGKVAKLHREGGTLRRVTPAGTSVTFDVLNEAQGTVTFDKRYVTNRVADVELSFTCKPFARGVAVTLADNVETTNPELVLTATDVAGDVPALGRLVIDDDQGNDQWFVMWGLQSRYLDTAATANLTYAASEMTPLGGSILAAGAYGAFGASSNVIRNTDLASTHQAIASTQASGGSHLTHVGDFVVWARVFCPSGNTGVVNVALEWGLGDFRHFVRNDEQTIDTTWTGSWRLVCLGRVHLAKVKQGTQRWEGRIITRSTVAGDEIEVNRLWLMPCTEGYGEARALELVAAPTTITARDGFDQAAGTLTGKALAVGGTWAGAGDADDFMVTGGGTATRSAADDAPRVYNGRIAIAGSSVLAASAVQVSVSTAALSNWQMQGIIARYTDLNNYLAAWINGKDGRVQVEKRVAGGRAPLAVAPALGSRTVNATHKILLVVTSTGRFSVYVSEADSDLLKLRASGQDAALATGGALATGRVGFFDNWIDSATPRTYDDFMAWPAVTNATIFAGQSIEVRHDDVIREDSSGAVWSDVSSYRGDLLRIPPAGLEDRSTRIIVKASRNDPDSGPDTSVDDLSARLTYTPRYLVIPA